ncbi:MAG: hypothetical protein V4510_12690, partial [bacterium]
MNQLKEQNNGVSWRDCESAGLRHKLGKAEPVRSLYGTTIRYARPSTIRHCHRCPVSIYTRGE